MNFWKGAEVDLIISDIELLDGKCIWKYISSDYNMSYYFFNGLMINFWWKALRLNGIEYLLNAFFQKSVLSGLE